MKIFGIMALWQHPNRGNICAPDADMSELSKNAIKRRE